MGNTNLTFLVLPLLFSILAYICWYYIILMYYKVFSFKLKGVPYVSFPLPFFGNYFSLKTHMSTLNEYS